MSGVEFKEQITPYLEVIKSCGEELSETDRSEFLHSMSLMFGEGFTPPECYFECVMSPKGYRAGKYESLPAILPRYFAPDHAVVKPAYDAISEVYTRIMGPNMSFVIIRAERVQNNKIEKGFLLYPSCEGTFRTEEKKEEFYSLFHGKPPQTPFAGVGTKFGPETFTVQEKRDCILEYLKKKYSMPKDVDKYWLKDEAMHNDLIFPLLCPYSQIRDENSKDAAIRGLWECTGLKVTDLEYLGQYHNKHVYSTNIYVDHAKWEWMNHQAEKMTLTNWDVCPHFGILEELGVPAVVLDAYCRTHGGPRFVTNLNDHLIENISKEVFLHFYTADGVLKQSESSKE